MQRKVIGPSRSEFVYTDKFGWMELSVPPITIYVPVAVEQPGGMKSAIPCFRDKKGGPNSNLHH